MTNCQICGKQVVMPFVCHSCGGYFCAKHRLPEAHCCSVVNQKVTPEDAEIQDFLKVRKIGSCPRCHTDNSKVLKNNVKNFIFRCYRCRLVYGQRKAYPYHYFHVHKKHHLHHVRKSGNDNMPIRNLQSNGPNSMVKKTSWVRKVVGITIVLVLLLATAYFLSNFYASPITSPITNPFSSPLTVSGTVVSVVGSTIGGNISGVDVSVIDSQGNEVMSSATNATGGFSFNELLPNSYTVQITVPYGHVATSATSYSVSSSRDLEFRLQNLLVDAKTVHYSYTLRGISSEIVFTVYDGMNNYLASIENSTVSYYAGQEPSPEEIDRIVTLRYVNEDVEKGELNNLANAIKQITSNEDDQARIAISLVQNIPYDWNALDLKYPYQVLYASKGDCDDKSGLLVSLLRELGYGCSILSFSSQSHAAVGIACPSQYEYYSGYAFVESTSPAIITDWSGDYVGVGKLPSSPSYVIFIQEGKVMNSVSEEYQDAQTFQSLINMGPVLDEYHYAQWQALVSKYGIPTS